MTSGRGRPLILTVLEPDEAMRILAGGDADETRLAAGLLGAGRDPHRRARSCGPR